MIPFSFESTTPIPDANSTHWQGVTETATTSSEESFHAHLEEQVALDESPNSQPESATVPPEEGANEKPPENGVTETSPEDPVTETSPKDPVTETSPKDAESETSSDREDVPQTKAESSETTSPITTPETINITPVQDAPADESDVTETDGTEWNAAAALDVASAHGAEFLAEGEFERADTAGEKTGEQGTTTDKAHNSADASPRKTVSSPTRELALDADDVAAESEPEGTDDDAPPEVKPGHTARVNSNAAEVSGETLSEATQPTATSQKQAPIAITDPDTPEGDDASNDNPLRTGKNVTASSAASSAANIEAKIKAVVAPENPDTDSSALPETPESTDAARPNAKEGDTTAASAQRFAQHLVSRSSDRGGEGTQLNNADQARFVDRVARAFQAAEGRNGVVRLRLSPPELGSLLLEIKVQGNALSARLETDTPMARSVLVDNLSMLRDRLAEQGVRVEQFDVELLDRRPSRDFDGGGRGAQRHPEEDEPSESNPSARDTSDTASDRPDRETRHGENDQLNVVI